MAKAALPFLSSRAKPGDSQRSILPAENILANTKGAWDHLIYSKSISKIHLSGARSRAFGQAPSLHVFICYFPSLLLFELSKICNYMAQHRDGLSPPPLGSESLGTHRLIYGGLQASQD